MHSEETVHYGDNQGNLEILREVSVLARYDPEREPLSSLCPDCSRNCQHLTTRRIEEHLVDRQGASSLRLDLTQKLQKQEEKHEYRFKDMQNTKEKKESLLAKSAHRIQAFENKSLSI